MRTCIILNPAAGSVNLEHLHEVLATVADVELVVSPAVGAGEQLAAEAVDRGFELVVAAGGDGTIAEVINGLARRQWRTRFGILPVGTGNDLARALGLPTTLEEMLEVLSAGHFRPIDVIHMTADGVERYFANITASGFREDVKERIEQQFKSYWGPFAYVAAAAEALPALTNYEMTLVVSDGEGSSPPLEMSISNLVVANARYFAAGIPIAPLAEPDDGRMDVVAIKASTPAQMALLGPLVLLGSHLASDTVMHATCTRLAVHSTPALPFHVDGLHITASDFRFEVLPRVLQVAVPPPTDA